MRSLVTRTAVAATVGVLTLSAIAADGDAPAGFTDEETGLFFAEQEAFFTPTTTGVGNVDYLAGELVGWGPDAPTGTTAFTVMNNYSTFTSLADAEDRYRHTFNAEGTFTGHLENIAIEFHWDGPATALCGLNALAFDLRVDGKTILFQDQAAPSANLMSSWDSDAGVTRFVFTNIHGRMDKLDLVGDETTEHTVYMNFANFYACNEARAIYGSAEAPARLLANATPQGRRGNWVTYTEVDVTNPPPPLDSSQR